MSNPVVLVPHDPAWKHLASEEAARISALLAGQLIAIHHVGSTAIPGIKAKPILDFLGVVHSLEAFDEHPGLLEKIGYQARGEMGIPGRRYFKKPAQGMDTHHVHIFQAGDANIDRHLLFRDYLQTHPKVARDYEHLKEELAVKFANDSPSYADAKTEFIRDIERRAALWRGSIFA